MIELVPCLEAIGKSFVGCVFGDFAFRALGVKDSTARYFAVHALFNTVMVITCAPDLLRVMKDPVDCLNGEYSDVQTAWTVGLHLMHIATAFHKLTPVDWAHHCVSCFLLCGLCFPFRYGPLLNVSNFFLCGLPGGIDYYLLFFTKMGWIEKFTEKRVNRWLNMVIRLPGVIMMLTYAACAMAYGNYHISPWLLAFQVRSFLTTTVFFNRTHDIFCAIFEFYLHPAVLDTYNAVFFADRVVGDFYIHNQMRAADAKAAKLRNGAESADSSPKYAKSD